MISSDQIALYTALATVAAITTALQGTVALVLVGQDDDARRRKRRSSENLPAYNDAMDDARRYFLAGLGMNIGAASVNGVVLVSWGGIVASLCSSGRWYLYWPFGAVAALYITLLIVSIVFLVRLCCAGAN